MISKKEYEKLKKDKKDGYEWVAKDIDGRVCAHTTKPKKNSYSWINNGGMRIVAVEGSAFEVLSWDDEEPREIDDLLEGYKMQEKKERFASLVEFHPPVHTPDHYIGNKGLKMRDVQENFAPRYAKYGGLAVSDAKDVFKYIGRAPLKKGLQDLHKAKKHLEWLIKRVEEMEQ